MRRDADARAPSLACALACVAALGCTTQAAAPDPLDARFAAGSARGAAELAPDFHARAERAREVARAARSAEARRDHTERASLLLAAAETEAERITLDRERAAQGAELLRLEAERVASALALRRTEAAIARAEAAREARAATARLFQVEAGAASAGGREPEQDVPTLLRRAQLTLAAARALGATDAKTAAAAEALQAVEDASKRGARARREAAEQALAAAERALGDARSATEAPTPEQIASLIEESRERGLAVTGEARGVVVRLERAFAAGSARWSPRGKAQLTHVRALLRTNPHGVVELTAQADATSPERRGGLAHARAERALDALEADATERERVRIASAPADIAVGDALEIAFTAYRKPATSP